MNGRIQNNEDNDFKTLSSQTERMNDIEQDPINRGLTEPDNLLRGENYKPYSLEQMNNFQKWVEEQKKK